jgi:hypothetical protein
MNKLVTKAVRNSIFLLLLVARDGISQEPKVTAHYTPLSPTEVLRLLPGAPDKWKITQSKASNQISSWLLTIAQRSFEYTPPPAAPNTQPPPPMKTSMTLMDTGGEQNTQFDNFKAGVLGNRESVLINGCPTIILRDAQGKERLTMTINNRFTFSVTTENQPANSSKAWAATLDLARALSAAKTSPTLTSLPDQVTIEVIDELNPRNNRHVVQPVRKNTSDR